MLGNWVKAITDAFGGFLDGIGTAIVDFFKVMVIESSVSSTGVRTFSETGELTVLAQIGLIGIGIGVAMAIVNWARKKVSAAR